MNSLIYLKCYFSYSVLINEGYILRLCTYCGSNVLWHDHCVCSFTFNNSKCRVSRCPRIFFFYGWPLVWVLRYRVVSCWLALLTLAGLSGCRISIFLMNILCMRSDCESSVCSTWRRQGGIQVLFSATYWVVMENRNKIFPRCNQWKERGHTIVGEVPEI